MAIWGNSKWKQKPRDEQAEADGTDECEKVSKLFGVNFDDLLKNLLKPRIKVDFFLYYKKTKKNSKNNLFK